MTYVETQGDDRLHALYSRPLAALILASIWALTGCVTASDVPLHTIISLPVSQGVALSRQAVGAIYVITAADDLTVRFYFNPQLDEDVRVRPDGKISLSLVGELDAKGKTPQALSQEITAAYAQYLAKSTAVVIVRRFSNARAFVGGSVQRPGIVDMQLGSVTALQSIAIAGGATDAATLKDVILVRKLPDQKQPFIMDLNLIRALNGSDPEQDVELMPDDEVFVPRSGMASTNLALQQLIYYNLNLSTYGGIQGTKTLP